MFEARNAAEKNGISILISNPCFELWYNLHFEYSTSFIKDYPSMRDKILPFDAEKVLVNVIQNTIDTFQRRIAVLYGKL